MNEERRGNFVMVLYHERVHGKFLCKPDLKHFPDEPLLSNIARSKYKMVLIYFHPFWLGRMCLLCNYVWRIRHFLQILTYFTWTPRFNIASDMRVLFMDIHLKKLVLLVFVFCKSNFEANIYKNPTWQSAAGQNAQYKGKTNDPGKHENSKGRKVSQIQTKCEEKRLKLLLKLKMQTSLSQRWSKKPKRKKETWLLYFSH